MVNLPWKSEIANHSSDIWRLISSVAIHLPPKGKKPRGFSILSSESIYLYSLAKVSTLAPPTQTSSCTYLKTCKILCVFLIAKGGRSYSFYQVLRVSNQNKIKWHRKAYYWPLFYKLLGYIMSWEKKIETYMSLYLQGVTQWCIINAQKFVS